MRCLLSLRFLSSFSTSLLLLGHIKLYSPIIYSERPNPPIPISRYEQTGPILSVVRLKDMGHSDCPRPASGRMEISNQFFSD